MRELPHCLLLIRHGRTQHNQADLITTHTDVPLDELGRAQAREAGRALRGWHFDRVLSSPLSRAAETARLITSEAGLQRPLLDPRLVEPSAGVLESHSFSTLQDESTERGRLYRRYCEYPGENPVEQAEPWEETLARAAQLLAEAAASPGRHLYVTHGAFIRIMSMLLMRADPAFYRCLKVDNCGMVGIKYYPHPPHQIVGLNTRF